MQNFTPFGEGVLLELERKQCPNTLPIRIFQNGSSSLNFRDIKILTEPLDSS